MSGTERIIENKVVSDTEVHTAKSDPIVVAVMPSSALDDFASATLPSRAHEVVHNNGVTRTVNPDGLVTYKGYGIEGILEEIKSENGVGGTVYRWTIFDATQYQALCNKVKELFIAECPYARFITRSRSPIRMGYHIEDFNPHLISGTIFIRDETSNEAGSMAENCKENELLNNERKLELAPSKLIPGFAMFHLLRRSFHGFKGSDGSPLGEVLSRSGISIGSKQDPATCGHYGNINFNGEPGSMWWTTLRISLSGVTTCDSVDLRKLLTYCLWRFFPFLNRSINN